MAFEASEYEHDRLYKEALAGVFPLIEVHGQLVAKLTPAHESQLRQGITLFHRVVNLNPRNWSAMWLLGKAYQRTGEFETALTWFSRAHEINPDQPDVSREAAIAAMELGRAADAAAFCQRAIQAKPNDPGLQANLALATLFTGDAKRAYVIVQNALLRDPSDEITGIIAEVCRSVLAGERPCPRHVRDM